MVNLRVSPQHLDDASRPFFTASDMSHTVAQRVTSFQPDTGHSETQEILAKALTGFRLRTVGLSARADRTGHGLVAGAQHYRAVENRVTAALGSLTRQGHTQLS